MGKKLMFGQVIDFASQLQRLAMFLVEAIAKRQKSYFAKLKIDFQNRIGS